MIVIGLQSFPRSDFMTVLPQITYCNMALIVPFHLHCRKKKYLHIVGVNRMFLNGDTFCITKKFIHAKLYLFLYGFLETSLQI
jgi:hypothetical protein